MSESISVWNWQSGEPVPDARVVVCRPEVLRDGSTVVNEDIFAAFERGTWVIVLSSDARRSFATDKVPAKCIPALHVRKHADLAGLPSLLAVKAERRALVVCPEEGVDITGLPTPKGHIGPCGCPAQRDPWERCDDCVEKGWNPPGIDLVVIVPPPESEACKPCGEKGSRSSRCPGCDICCCERCGGKGRVEAWPMHPAWVRGIVEQCRAAGVPVVLLSDGAESDPMPVWV